MINTTYFVNNGKYPTSVDLVILNPIITVIFWQSLIQQSQLIWFPT